MIGPKLTYILLSMIVPRLTIAGIQSRLNRSTKLFTAATKIASTTTPSVGIYTKYEIVDSSTIDEYNLKATLYRHKKSGAQVMSVIADDENKVFGITFRTPPKDSTGIPHILEHSVLCGSRKFPVKEPFVDLLKGSLQNFLNAFTYPDRTCYPVASTNTKDFYNLAHVYLDAVFFPRAINDPQVLQQEGWHYECEDPSEPLTYKGVVYNEMKGVYSSPDSLLGRATQQALFPDNTYGVDSGGDPLVIPSLTFESFRQFHASYYHPSNSRAFFYGNDDPDARLTLLDEYLSEFDAITVASAVQVQPKRLTPTYITQSFPLSPGSEPKHILTVNWLVNDAPLSSKERLALGMLDDLLLGTSSAMLRKALTESQLGESVTGGGLSDELYQAIFGVGLKGVKAEDVSKVEPLVLSTLETAAQKGFEKDAIDASLNTLEFRLREFNTGSFPRGLSIMLGMMSQWIYDGSPFDAIRFEEPLKELKKDLAEGRPVFQDLLKKYFLANQHRVTVEMNPVNGLETVQNQEEVSRLVAIKETMSPEDIQQVIESTKKLKAAQLAEDTEEAKSTIPRLTLQDIDPKVSELPIEVVVDGRKEYVTGNSACNSAADSGLTVLTHEVPSSGILYLDIALDYSDLTVDELPYMALFSRMLLESGTYELDDVTLTRKIGSQTGGIFSSFYSDLKHSEGKIADQENAILYFILRGKAVYDKIPALVGLMRDVLLTANLGNQKRAVEMLKESKVRKQSSVVSSGHTYAATRLASRYSLLGYMGEITGGLTSVRAAPNILSTAENNWTEVQAKLESIRSTLLKKNNAVINLSADKKTLEAGLKYVNTVADQLQFKNGQASEKKPLWQSWRQHQSQITKKNEGFIVPSQINYVCKGGPIYKTGEAISGAMSVVTRYLSTGYLWDNVRVVGGAYGGFARFSETSGRMVYLSYRDPNLYKTLEIYDNTASHLKQANITSEDILQAVVGTIGDMDSPLSPDQKGFTSMTQFLVGETSHSRQRVRDEVLKTQVTDFREFAERLMTLVDEGTTIVVGSQTALEQANSQIVSESKKLVLEPAFTDA